MSKRWQKVEVQYLTKHATSKTVEELATRFHTDAAEVTAKLVELGLVGDASDRSKSDEAAALAAFESGLAALQAGKYADAAKSLELAAAIGDESPDLAARSRQYLIVAHRHLETAPSGDAYALAVWAKNSGDVAGAHQQASRNAKTDERFAYLAAATAAISGDHSQALDFLAKAIELSPRNSRHAAHDPDFEALRGDAAFAALVRA